MIAWISLVVFGILFLFKNTRFVRHLILMGDNESLVRKWELEPECCGYSSYGAHGF